MKKYSRLVLLLFLSVVTLSVEAQKQPNIQSGNQWLPAATKIDGKLSEWSDSLKAFNKATRLEYTIANDDKNLYLAIRSKDIPTTAKILTGGVSFIFEGPEKSNVSGNRSVIFPATNAGYIYSAETGWPERTFKILSDSLSIREAIADSKVIKVSKLMGVSDSILSVYNEYGIKAKMDFSNAILTYELSIPLNLIEYAIKDGLTFSYIIRLNGVPIPTRPANIVKPTRFPNPVIGPDGVIESEIQNATNFEGKYTLAHK